MKICFVGLGSIGKRHLSNLVRLLEEKQQEYTIDALRNSKTELPDEVVGKLNKQYEKISDLKEMYDIIFITNPTIKHYETWKGLLNQAKYFFIEKPVFERFRPEIDLLEADARKRCYVACPLRFSQVIQYVENHIQQEDVFSVRVISSSYLPAWRNGIDYRKVYSADKAMGGGVTLDLIHELDYIIHLFGEPEKICNMRGKFSDLEINSDDLSIYMLQYHNKLIEIHLDYFGRNTMRRIELFCRDYVMEGDFIQNTITYRQEGKEHRIQLLQEDFYHLEMKYFLENVLESKDNCNDIKKANRILRLADEFEVNES